MPSFVKVLSHFTNLLEKLKIPYALIGGLAVGLLARERATLDVDLTIAADKKKTSQLMQIFRPRSSYKVERVDFVSSQRIPDLIRVRWKHISVDLLFANIAYQRGLIKRAITFPLGQKKIRVVTPSDLLILKLIAFRPQDRADISSLLEQGYSLDWTSIKKWAKRWGVAERLKEFALYHPD